MPAFINMVGIVLAGDSDPEVRHRRAEGRAPAVDARRRAALVPAVLRARRGERPRLARDARRARRGALDRQRPEGLDEWRPLLRLGHPHGPNRRRRAEAQRHLVLPDGHVAARHRGTTAAADDRRGRVRRGLLHRCRDADRRARSARRTRAGWSAWRPSRASEATSALRSSGSSAASSRSLRWATAISAPWNAIGSPRCSRAATPTERSPCARVRSPALPGR